MFESGEGRSWWVVLGLERETQTALYISVLPSQAADARANLWTYVIRDPFGGPTHTHSHTVPHVPSVGSPSYCPL